MSTRSNVVIMEGKKQLVRIYRQCDGYPTGIGNDIKRILANGKVEIVNGYSGGMKNPTHFNGMGCLAAYLIREMKEGIGGVYIDGRKKLGANDFDIEYEYVISTDDVHVRLEVRARMDKTYKSIWSGLLSEFDGAHVEGLLEAAS